MPVPQPRADVGRAGAELPGAATLITNIGALVTDGATRGTDPLGPVTDSAPVIDGTDVARVGPRAGASATDRSLDAGGGAAVPGSVDSHSRRTGRTA
ncbi:hypothetical protein WDA79_17270 [Streptomyces sp. A475]|uniref:hypothetical protein n=1 Tax=Streptomyces sp. A475 TaxID=3131976 RepID=UPI0030C985C8